MTYIPYSIDPTRDAPGCRAASRSDRLPDGSNRNETGPSVLACGERNTKDISA